MTETLTREARHDITIAGAPEGLDAMVLARLVEEAGTPAQGKSEAKAGLHVHVARDDRRVDALETTLAFFAPAVKIVPFPAWDTVPYDRVGPNADIVAKRISALARLALSSRKEPTLVLTTVNAVLQRVPPRSFVREGLRPMAPGQRMDLARLIKRMTLSGFRRVSQVIEPGEFAVRGGIVDLFAPGRSTPIRLDFFGDTLESIKSFDPTTQRTTKPVQKFALMPVSEVAFGEDAVARFRQRYVSLFGGAVASGDPLYEAVTSGARWQGQEHWLPLYHETLETLFDFVPDASVSFDHMSDQAVAERFEQVREHYAARVDALEATKFGAPPYRPVPPDQMFLDGPAWGKAIAGRKVYRLTPFEQDGADVRSWRGRPGRTFQLERQNPDANLFDAVAAHLRTLQGAKKRAIVAAWSPGSRERLATLFADHGLTSIRKVDSYAEALALPGDMTALAVLGLERGFETPEIAFVGEQDILGDRMVRQRKKPRKATDVIAQAAALSVGDLVVHADHGIGRFIGLQTITALGSAHDCLELHYAGGDKLFLPVENIELLSRYGSDSEDAHLDRLGGAGWQSRKARLKKRLHEMAAELIKTAAMRQLKEAPAMQPPTGAYEEFVARFPYEETEDQMASIDAVMADLSSGRPMDRLVCGDVGFGKTEVAMRAAFTAAISGFQVAVVVPTTLLARQHYRNFAARFEGLPLKIAQASRLVSAKDLTDVRNGIADGQLDIVVGTHALLAKSIEFKRLGLMIIDEEQHFGVAHKERLKKMREDVHVLTLTATPIPRTLQLALTGVRELSLITTPPVDRLAVRTFVSPFDPVVLREALRRERYRGGQTYFVCPRLADLDDIAEFLSEATPELRVARAHGQLPPTELEDIMTGFYEGRFDVLLSTAIVESGLDVPNANTLIVHRADMFGLAQLYQLRGRVGRSKTRAYAYLTTPADKALTEGAEKRLKVLGALDQLGAGFTLASHDLDLRGGGNLLGEEQSGHIREVGFELYQQMLEDEISKLKSGDLSGADDQWSPQISIGTSILIPETYVTDLPLRLSLYRRLSSLETRSELDDFASELADRFGPPPEEVTHLLDVMEIKSLCRAAHISNLDAGAKGAVVTFRGKAFPNPQALLELVATSRGNVKLQPDQRVVFKGAWDLPEQRLKGVRMIAAQLSALVELGKKKAA